MQYEHKGEKIVFFKKSSFLEQQGHVSHMVLRHPLVWFQYGLCRESLGLGWGHNMGWKHSWD